MAATNKCLARNNRAKQLTSAVPGLSETARRRRRRYGAGLERRESLARREKESKRPALQNLIWNGGVRRVQLQRGTGAFAH
jgi:hypothetical protein